MSEKQSIEALDHLTTATWEQERSTSELKSYIGSLATRIGLSEYDADQLIDEQLAA